MVQVVRGELQYPYNHLEMNAHIDEHRDFFVSYNHADEKWATWIAWTLEQEGYSVYIQAWDFRPGSNFALEMHKSVQNTDRTIAVVSPDFLQSTFTAPEWAAAFATDPMGVARKLVPVRVSPCQTDGLLGQMVRIDLVGRDVIDAQKELLSGLELGRAKPLVAPAFPGPASPTAPALSRAPSPPVGQSRSGGPHWHVLPAALEAQWQLVGDRYNHPGSTALELQLVPTEPLRIEVRKLAALKDELARLARSSGLIPTALAVDTTASDQLAMARSHRSNYDVNAGLVVLRNGQRGGWLNLPRDSMGAVLDPDDLPTRVAMLLKLLVEIPAPVATRYGVAVGLSPITTLTIGNTDVVGRRTSASFPYTSRDAVIIQPDDALSTDDLRTYVGDIAEELVARTVAKLNSRN
jgi:hypothetical protein